MGVFDKLLGGGILGSAVSGLFGIGQQVMANIYNKKEAEKNRDFQSQEAELNRLFQSNEAALQRDWSSQEAEQARDWQEEMYAKYNSLSGKIAQAEQAGVNPMFAVTGGAVSPMSATSSAPSGASAGSVGTPSGSAASASLVNILGGILDAYKMKSEVAMNEALAKKYISEANATDKNTSWVDRINEMKIGEMASNISKNESQVNKDIQDIKESVSRVEVNNSVIQLNGANIKLVGSQSELNATQSIINKLNADQLEKLMPYVQARQEAAIALTNAQTDESKFNAEKLMYEANVKMLEGMRDANLLDSSYYNNIIEQSKWDAKQSKRDFKWTPANNVCSNISKIAVGIGSVASGFASVVGIPSAPVAVNSPAILSFF